MRVRVLFTNGTRTIDLFWLKHDGSEVYCGQSGFAAKRSYHASGKVHSTSNAVRTDEGWHTPLRDFKKQFHLTTIALSNSARWFDAVDSKYDYSGRMSDAVLVIDSRSIPEQVQINVSIGLLEPGRMDILHGLLLQPTEAIASFPVSAKQLLLSTAVEPWVYVVFYWVSQVDELSSKGVRANSIPPGCK